MKIDETHFSALCLLPHQALLDYSRRVASLIELLHGHPGAEALPELQKTPSSPPRDFENLNLPHRPPMRAPQKGSIRACVHEVLRRAAQPMRRRDVISAVAAERGLPADKLLEAKVGEALGNRHDHSIQKTGPGVYAIVPTQDLEAICL